MRVNSAGSTLALLGVVAALQLISCRGAELSASATTGPLSGLAENVADTTDWLEMSVSETKDRGDEAIWIMSSAGRAVRGRRVDGETRVEAWAHISRAEFGYLVQLLDSYLEAPLKHREALGQPKVPYKIADEHTYEIRLVLSGEGGSRVYDWRFMHGGAEAWALQSLVEHVATQATWREDAAPPSFDELLRD